MLAIRPVFPRDPKATSFMNEPIPIRPAWDPLGATSLESDALDVANAIVGLHGGYAIVSGTDPTTNTQLCAAIADSVLSGRIGFLADFGYDRPTATPTR